MEPTRVASTPASPSTSQPSHGAGQVQRAKGNTQNQGPAHTANPGDFMALLAGLNESVDELNAPPDSTGDPLTPEALLPAPDPQVADAATLAAWQGVLVPRDAAVSVPGLVSRGGDGGGQGLAGLQAMRDVASLAGQGSEAGLSSSGVLPGKGERYAPGPGAEAALSDTAADLRGGAMPNAGSGYGRAFTRLHNAMSQRSETSEGFGLRGTVTAASADRSSGPLAAALAATAPMQIQSAAGATPAAVPDRAVAWGMAESAVDPGGLAPSSGAPAQDSGARGSAEGSGSRDLGYGAGGFAEPAGLGGAVEPFDSAVLSDAPQSPAEDQIAEQVAYWVNQETQNAELTVTRDGLPVEVSVSISGNEAHVTFRSDQEQTRELLDRSMAQLSELLRGEGLVLSGMSVGSSAGRSLAGGNGGEQKRQREEGRQAEVRVAASVGPSVANGGRASDRSIDVFV